MGVEGSVCLGVCVCLFLFIDEMDTWKCVFVCLRIYASDCFLSFLLCLGLKLKGRFTENGLKKTYSLSQGSRYAPPPSIVSGFLSSGCA